MAGWIVLALWMSRDSSAVHATGFDHVRSAESEIRVLIAEGYARSATFRQLVDTTEALPCIVYIATVVKLSQRMNGALLHEAAGRRDAPILRILLKTNLSREEAIAVIGHELQHVFEFVSQRPAAGGDEFEAAFDALDPRARAAGDRTYETDAAVVVTTKIRDELRRSPRR